jgi:hypothetical protein
MVGVAPMAGGTSPLAFAPPGAAPAPAGGSPAQPPNTPLMGGEGASAYSPPVPQAGGVNPLGGTLVAADAGVFGAYAIQQQGQQPAPPGGAAAPGPFGGQPTPQAFGTAPVPGFPAAPPYVASPPPTLSASGGVDPFAQPSPPQQYGQPAMQPAGQGTPGVASTYGQEPPGHMVGTLKSEAARVAGPTRRNALVTLLLPAAIMFGGMILSILLAILVTPGLGALGMLFVLGGAVFYLLLGIQMIAELKAVTHSEQLAWWALLVPLYSLVFMWFLVPQEVAKAKQMLGKPPPQPIVLYIFLWPFALASDLNDMVRG